MIKYYFECGLNIIIYNIFQSIVIKQDLWKNPEICFTSSNTKNNFFILKKLFYCYILNIIYVNYSNSIFVKLFV